MELRPDWTYKKTYRIYRRLFMAGPRATQSRISAQMFRFWRCRVNWTAHHPAVSSTPWKIIRFSKNRATTPRADRTPRGELTWVRIGRD
jgi:hypothetical protein